MKFQELTLADRCITSSTYELTFVLRDQIIYTVSGEFDATVTIKDFNGSYEEEPYRDINITSLNIDFKSIEIYDHQKDDTTDLVPSKYLLDLIETELTEYIEENCEDFEEDYDWSDYND